MAHNFDNRRRRELRHRRAYMKAVRRFDAFERQSKRDPDERFRLWLKCWRAQHPDDSRDEQARTRIYETESAIAK